MLQTPNKENWNEFSYFIEGKYGLLMGDLSDIPIEVEDYWTVNEAFQCICKNSCLRLKRGTTYELTLKILRWYFANFAEVFPILYRGINEGNADTAEDEFIFTTPNKVIAEWYAGPTGTIKEYRNTKGIAFKSPLKSVLTDDWSQSDIEVLVFK